MNALLDALLGHAPAQLRYGELFLARAPSSLVLVTLAAALVLLAWLTYRRTTLPLSRAARGTLVALRSATLLLIAAALLQPAVRSWHVVPQETWLAVLVDDSASMRVQDVGEESRGAFAEELVFGAGGLAESLQRNYRTRLFRFSAEAERISAANHLSRTGMQSALGEGLVHVLDELKGFPVAAFLLISDGADNSAGGTDPLQAAHYLDAAEIPVFTLGLGAEEIARDIELASAAATRTVADENVFLMEASITQAGYAGEEVELVVERGADTVARRRVRLGGDGSVARAQLEVHPDEEGYLLYRFAVQPGAGEVIAENNERMVLVDNRPAETLDVLYVEGRPRNEYKFLQRAAAAETTVRLASYLRTGPGKFLRQGVASPRELASGFPDTEKDLFGYEAIILGELPRTELSDRQIAMIGEFVARRGGGFLALGHMDEGYIGTAIADLLPLTLLPETELPFLLQGGTRPGGHPSGEDFSLALTREGRAEPFLRLSSDDRTNDRIWSQLPTLQGIAVTGKPKPGAQVLAQHPTLTLGADPLPVIAVEKYGKGRTMAITSASTWRWQMLAAVDDPSHERIWRQILRWLAVASPPRLVIQPARQDWHVGEPLEVDVRVSDTQYDGDNDASVWLEATAPDGTVQDFQLRWQIDGDGVYRGRLEATQEGVYRVTATATTAQGEVLEASRGLLAASAKGEFRDAGMDRGLLERIAQITGGRFYTAADAGRIAEDIEFAPNRYAREENRDLWDLPILLAMILLLCSVEWSLRRSWGLT